MRITLLAILACLIALPSSAQPGKKIYISVDMEGISGVTGDDQTGPGGAEYGRARKLMAEDANAAIRGAFAGGATDASSTTRTAASAICCPRISIRRVLYRFINPD